MNRMCLAPKQQEGVLKRKKKNLRWEMLGQPNLKLVYKKAKTCQTGPYKRVQMV
jgi:hypothetical protein